MLYDIGENHDEMMCPTWEKLLLVIWGLGILINPKMPSKHQAMRDEPFVFSSPWPDLTETSNPPTPGTCRPGSPWNKAMKAVHSTRFCWPFVSGCGFEERRRLGYSHVWLSSAFILEALDTGKGSGKDAAHPRLQESMVKIMLKLPRSNYKLTPNQ